MNIDALEQFCFIYICIWLFFFIVFLSINNNKQIDTPKQIDFKIEPLENKENNACKIEDIN